jgi:hypothetical protein
MQPRKRASRGISGPNKRARGSASQPITVNSQPSPTPLSLPLCAPRPLVLQSLVSASQAPDFELQLCESQPKDSIVVPTEGSEQAAVASSKATLEVEGDEAFKAFDAHLEDSFDGLEWSHLPKYMKPVTTYQQRKSWVYRHGYRVALCKLPSGIYRVCHYCYQHKYTNIGRRIYYTSGACSAAARHLAENKPGYWIIAPNKPLIVKKDNVFSALKKGKLPISQAVANKLGGFNIERFRLVAVEWLVENNHPLSEFRSLGF